MLHLTFGIAVFALVGTAPAPTTAMNSASQLPGSEIVAHGGGCRKDSPAGQCCHAGSKLYHCH
ncbi:hypothetical protein [Algicella marina]|uniref:YHYH domain-containing protein n=1 Tax=Algicella marina TaxID=2683284 RepID=A0A6P1T5C5_9RHOB|nr:hypothetical protein [Algicella marina]QHQ36686.1 hypothetical protein GO499_16655 [Algicella marina]